MAGNLHISINAEKVFDVAGVPISNSILTTWVVLILILLLASKTYKTFKRSKYSDKPSRFQSLMEMIIESLYGLVKGTAGEDKKARAFFPIVATFFIFIILSNWIGLLPGVGTIGFRETHVEQEVHEEVSEEMGATEGSMLVDDSHQVEVEDLAPDTHVVEAIEADEHAIEGEVVEEHAGDAENQGSSFVPYFRGPTADLNTTLALGVISIFFIQFTGFRFLGVSYSKKFLNFSGPIDFFVGFLELVSEISKIISFAFRLFGNIFAGEVLLAVIAFLMPLLGPIPFLGLEIFVGFIQALVFAMLTLVFLNIATMGHGAEDH